MGTRWKAILSVLMVMLCLAGLFLFFSIRMQRQNLNRIIEGKEESARLLLESVLGYTSQQYRSRIRSFINAKASKSRADMVRAFARQDRQTLLALSKPLFSVLQRENEYFSTIGWVLPEKRVFLRVHEPDLYGDEISSFRPDVGQALDTQKQVTGFEVGLRGMQFRVIEPVFFEGKFAGVVQFGINSNLLLDTLEQKLSVLPLLVISREKRQKAKFFSQETVDCSDFVARGKDVSLIKEHCGKLDLTLDKQFFSTGNKEFILITALVLRDYKQQPIGKIIVPLDITSEVQQTKDFVFYSILATCGLLFLAFLLLYLSFGKMLQRIFSLNENLELSNKKLIGAKQKVEAQVAERTAELLSANRELHNEIAERVKAEQEKSDLEKRLVQSQKMEAIGTLAGGIAHDFNNILSAILGYAELSLLHGEEKTEIENNLKHIAKAGRRAKDLVSQILTFSRQAKTKPQPLQLSLIVKEALKLLRSSLPSTITILQEIEDQKTCVMADPIHLHQVVMNLCANAAHAMSGATGELSVCVKSRVVSVKEAQHCHIEPGSYVILTVSDTGVGMEPDIVNRIFDPFFTTKGVGEGTGMGLSVVHGIVQSMSGGLTVESTAGKGSSFHVFLPQCKSVTDYVEEEVRSALPGGTEKILLVDDEKEVIGPIQTLLSSIGYEVVSSLSAVAALQLFEQQPDFDLVITDYTMPEMTGLALAAELMRLRPDMPIIMCTGYSSKVSEEKALAAGIKKFYMKPVSLYEIARGIRDVLDGHSHPQSAH
ncbi:MAG: response regulator [Desulfobulbaceae bacterium]|nr:response regulator [Desulfobulbaceae bacterium]